MADVNYISQITLPNNVAYLLKASSVPLAGVTEADDLKAIEKLTGTSGILKKTAANTWTLDTTAYTTNTGTVTSITLKAGNGIILDTDNTAITTSGTRTISASYGSSTAAVSTTSSAGTAATLSRSDHVHAISLATGDNNGQIKIAGTNVSVKGLAALAYKATLAATDIPDLPGAKITSGTVAAARLGLMMGATSTADGASGAVTKPTKGQQSYYLRGDATWVQPTVTIAGTKVNIDGAIDANTLRTNLGLDSAMHYRGVVAAIPPASGTYVSGDVVVLDKTVKEYVYDGTSWRELGTEGSYKVRQSKVSTATAETTTATTFVHSVTQDENGQISVTTRPLPAYNNYSLPLAANGTRGGIQIGYTTTGKNYAVQLDGEKAYVNVPWTNVNSSYLTGITSTTTGTGNAVTAVSASGNTITVTKGATFNNYTHPTGDGNLHVPATGTTNDGKFLKAGATAGSLSWANAVTSVAAGDGLTGSTITTAGSLKANLRSFDKLTNDSAAATETANRVYPVALDKSGFLAVNVPWSNTQTLTGVKGNSETAYRTGNVNLTAANIGAKAVQTAVSSPNASGTAIAFIDTISQNAQGVITPTRKTVATFGAASSTAAGSVGLVPAPAQGDQGKFLRADGTWQTNVSNSNWTTHLYAGSGTAGNAATTNGNTKLTVTDNTTVRNSVTIKGTGATTVTSDANGVITVDSANTNTTYTIASGDANGQIKVTPSSGDAYNVDIKGLGTAAYTASTAYMPVGTGVTAVAWDSTNTKVTRTINGTAADVVAFKGTSPITVTGAAGQLTIAHATGAGSKHIPSGGSSGQFLGWDSAGTAKWVSNPNTDTKVTSVGNHYTPATDTDSTLTANASGATAAWNIDVVKGISLERDARGHVTGLSVTSGKIPANPNSDTKVNMTARGTTKAYLLATSTSPTTTAQGVTALAETGVYLDTTAGKLVATTFQGALSGNAATASKLGTSTVGSATKPIYLSSGTATECTTYAGGTAVTLNGTSAAGSTASFFAPTAGGTANTQALVGNGAAAAPKWVNIAPSLTVGAGTASAAPTVNVSVLGQSGTAQSITTATTGVYGVTKLQDGVASTSTTLAATANAAKVASGTATHTLANTTKFFVTGTTTSTTNTGGDNFDNGVYVTTTAGEISAMRHSYNTAGSEKAYTYYNPTDKSIDFIFL